MEKQRSMREWLRRRALRIATDATWVFVIVITLSLGSSFFSMRYLSGLESDIGELYENDIKGQTYAQNAYVSLLGIESAEKDLIISEREEERMEAADALRAQSASLRSLVLKATPTIDSAKYRTLIAKSKAHVSAFIAALQKGLGDPGEKAPTAEAGKALLADLRPSLAALRNDLLTLNEIKRSANRNFIREVRLQLRISLAITIAILTVSLAVRIFLFRASRRAARTACSEDSSTPRG
ncbi:MAG: MCP four helix bundle domain-containing protein [Rectinemataceae bacterium]